MTAKQRTILHAVIFLALIAGCYVAVHFTQSIAVAVPFWVASFVNGSLLGYYLFQWGDER